MAPPAVEVGDAAALLELARLVAHGTGRRNAPLATFLVGLAAGRAADPAAAIPAARDLARQLLDPR